MIELTTDQAEQWIRDHLTSADHPLVLTLAQFKIGLILQPPHPDSLAFLLLFRNILVESANLTEEQSELVHKRSSEIADHLTWTLFQSFLYNQGSLRQLIVGSTIHSVNKHDQGQDAAT
jgi:hypothetical protein